MHLSQDTAGVEYPHGRGYGHDYMRGGEVLGGYGYADREDYEKRRGEAPETQPENTGTGGTERS